MASESLPLNATEILKGQRTDVHCDATDSPPQDATDYDCARGLCDVGRACMGYVLRRY